MLQSPQTGSKAKVVAFRATLLKEGDSATNEADPRNFKRDTWAQRRPCQEAESDGPSSEEEEEEEEAAYRS